MERLEKEKERDLEQARQQYEQMLESGECQYSPEDMVAKYQDATDALTAYGMAMHECGFINGFLSARK